MYLGLGPRIKFNFYMVMWVGFVLLNFGALVQSENGKDIYSFSFKNKIQMGFDWQLVR
jgi:hypothetical protein